SGSERVRQRSPRPPTSRPESARKPPPCTRSSHRQKWPSRSSSPWWRWPCSWSCPGPCPLFSPRPTRSFDPGPPSHSRRSRSPGPTVALPSSEFALFPPVPERLRFRELPPEGAGSSLDSLTVEPVAEEFDRLASETCRGIIIDNLSRIMHRFPRRQGARTEKNETSR